MPATVTTTRAYTLRLSGPEESNWRDLLWNTHCAVNRGVQVWGDWLLTLRGGLPAALADDPELLPITDKEVKAGIKKRKLADDESEEGRQQELERQRVQSLRVVLALSWLSVEAPASLVPERQIVARGLKFAPDADRHKFKKQQDELIEARFCEILQRKRIRKTEHQQWKADCLPALTARIRDDAVWVDRSQCFDELAGKCGKGFNPQWAANTLFFLLGGVEEYFKTPDLESTAAPEAKDFVQKAGNWLSTNWGAGAKSDASSIAERLEILAEAVRTEITRQSPQAALATLCRALKADPGDTADRTRLFKLLKQSVGWKGRPSKGALALEKIVNAERLTKNLCEQVRTKLLDEAADQRQKGENSAKAPSWMPSLRAELESRIGMPYRTHKDLIWEQAVMLDHALRRVSAGHTWIKRAEAARRRFQEDAARMSALKTQALDAVEWLDDYCTGRSVESEASGAYFIRKNAIDGWENVLRKWNLASVDSAEKRVATVRDLQDELEKFGDARLFEDLATGEAQCVWRDGADILKGYVAARVAEYNQQRFKVPAYRHPDPLRNPIYTDYGKSRWGISYSAHNRVKLNEKLKKAKTDAAREKIREQLAEESDVAGVSLSVWTGEAVEALSLRWHGKRLKSDLNFNDFDKSGVLVSRADRFGRAVANVPAGVAVTVADVFSQNDWNGRLQLSRAELDRLAERVYESDDHGILMPDYARLEILDEKSLKQRARLKWFLSFSAKLRPAGPWLDFVDEHELRSGNPAGIEYKNGRNGWFLSFVENQGRKGRTRIRLARLPAGLRILSFDLGHRYGAACAVWETLSTKQFLSEIQSGEVIAGGKSKTDLFAHVRFTSNDGKSKTKIYRRIAPDDLDGTAPPSTWARLDRQFLIKLQGETSRVGCGHERNEGGRKIKLKLPPTRRSTEVELGTVNELRTWLGLKRIESNANLETVGGPSVDQLFEDAVRDARCGLRRHGDYARIAYALTAIEEPSAGGRSINLTRPENRKRRIQFIQKALLRWKELAHPDEDEFQFQEKYNDPWATEQYRRWILQEFGGPDEDAEPDQESGRSKRQDKLQKQLAPFRHIAERLVDRDNSDLHQLWAEQWAQRDQEWKPHLRQLRRRMLPRLGKRPAGDHGEFKVWKEQAKALRHVGGLSYRRLRTIRELYRVMKAYRMRPEPDNPRKNVPATGDDRLAKFGQRILNQLERLREQRVKQLASRIVEAALGVGSEDVERHWTGKRNRKRPRQRIDDPRFKPCHVVVAENLEHYRPEESRTRRENRQLADWSARHLRRYVVESCQLHGLYFLEVSPQYTSRQDSRTGAPGIRCQDVPKDKLIGLKGDRYWLKQIRTAIAAVDSGKGTLRDKLLAKLCHRLQETPDKVPTVIRLPRRGSELFVAAGSEGRSALQADLNAAANIGLKALIDPDWPTAWWNVPVFSRDGATDPGDFPGSPLLGQAPLKLLRINEDRKEPKREKTNAWCDVSTLPLDSPRREWVESNTQYWQRIEARVVRQLTRQLGISLDGT